MRFQGPDIDKVVNDADHRAMRCARAIPGIETLEDLQFSRSDHHFVFSTARFQSTSNSKRRIPYLLWWKRYFGVRFPVTHEMLGAKVWGSLELCCDYGIKTSNGHSKVKDRVCINPYHYDPADYSIVLKALADFLIKYAEGDETIVALLQSRESSDIIFKRLSNYFLQDLRPFLYTGGNVTAEVLTPFSPNAFGNFSTDENQLPNLGYGYAPNDMGSTMITDVDTALPFFTEYLSQLQRELSYDPTDIQMFDDMDLDDLLTTNVGYDDSGVQVMGGVKLERPSSPQSQAPFNEGQLLFEKQPMPLEQQRQILSRFSDPNMDSVVYHSTCNVCNAEDTTYSYPIECANGHSDIAIREQQIHANGADIAYYMKKAVAEGDYDEGDIVGFFPNPEKGIMVMKLLTKENHKDTVVVGVISRSSYHQANAPTDGEADVCDLVCMIGYVDVNIKGPVFSGDLVFTNPESDIPGTGISRSTTDSRSLPERSILIGQALQSGFDGDTVDDDEEGANLDERVHKVKCLVSLLNSTTSAEITRAMSNIKDTLVAKLHAEVTQAFGKYEQMILENAERSKQTESDMEQVLRRLDKLERKVKKLEKIISTNGLPQCPHEATLSGRRRLSQQLACALSISHSDHSAFAMGNFQPQNRISDGDIVFIQSRITGTKLRVCCDGNAYACGPLRMTSFLAHVEESGMFRLQVLEKPQFWLRINEEGFCDARGDKSHPETLFKMKELENDFVTLSASRGDGSDFQPVRFLRRGPVNKPTKKNDNAFRVWTSDDVKGDHKTGGRLLKHISRAIIAFKHPANELMSGLHRRHRHHRRRAQNGSNVEGDKEGSKQRRKQAREQTWE